MDKVLYVTDLDGTLLRSDQRISPYTLEVINGFTKKGGLFAYATARSLITARLVTQGLDSHAMSITYNGAITINNQTEQPVIANYHDQEDLQFIRGVLNELGIIPIVFAHINGRERFSFLPQQTNPGIERFLADRITDVRRRAVETEDALYDGKVFTITCIGEEEPFLKAVEELKKGHSIHCIYQRDVYTDDPWLDILPNKATKANAVLQLKEFFGCDKVVCFGDGMNDISMFQVADECYAVENAVAPLKAIATDIILDHNQDGVAKWIAQHGLIYRGETK